MEKNIPLTARQLEIVKLVVQGKSCSQIGGILGISYKTVGTHRSRAMVKLKVRNVPELVRWAIREGIIEP